MSDKPISAFPAIPRPVAQASGGAVIHLNVAMEYGRLQKSSQGRLPTPQDYATGTILIQEGVRLQNPCAAFVLQGELHERQTHYATTEGHQTHTVATIGSGGVAFVQALFPNYANDPADVTVIVAAKATVVWITTQEHIQLLKRNGLIAEIHFEARRQAQRSLVSLRLAYKIQSPFIKYAAQLMKQEGLDVSPDKIFEALTRAYAALPKLKKRILEYEAQNQSLTAALQAKTCETEKLQEKTDGSKDRRIAELEEQLEAARAQAKRAARDNYELLEEHATIMQEASERASDYFTRVGDLFMNIQGGLAVLGITLDRLGITEQDRQILRETMPLGDDLDSAFEDVWNEEPRTNGKLGDTVPPEDIREAPTVPPLDEVQTHQPLDSAPPSTDSVPLTRALPDSVDKPDRPAPVSMPLVKKTTPGPQSGRSYSSRKSPFNQTAKWELDPKIKRQLKDEMERLHKADSDSTTQKPAVKPPPRPPNPYKG